MGTRRSSELAGERVSKLVGFAIESGFECVIKAVWGFRPN